MTIKHTSKSATAIDANSTFLRFRSFLNLHTAMITREFPKVPNTDNPAIIQNL